MDEWTNAYDNNTATVNGVKDVKVFKIGTSKNAGTATITILPELRKFLTMASLGKVLLRLLSSIIMVQKSILRLWLRMMVLQIILLSQSPSQIQIITHLT
jgi:hypothetical protein